MLFALWVLLTQVVDSLSGYHPDVVVDYDPGTFLPDKVSSIILREFNALSPKLAEGTYLPIGGMELKMKMTHKELTRLIIL